LVELRAFGVWTQAPRAVDRVRPLAGTAELDEPQARDLRLLELVDLFHVAVVRVARGLEARRQRVSGTGAHPVRWGAGGRCGPLSGRPCGKGSADDEEQRFQGGERTMRSNGLP